MRARSFLEIIVSLYLTLDSYFTSFFLGGFACSKKNTVSDWKRRVSKKKIVILLSWSVLFNFSLREKTWLSWNYRYDVLIGIIFEFFLLTFCNIRYFRGICKKPIILMSIKKLIKSRKAGWKLCTLLFFILFFCKCLK